MNPRRGVVEIKAPASGETIVASFPVEPNSKDAKGATVWLSLRVKGQLLPFHEEVLYPVIYDQEQVMTSSFKKVSFTGPQNISLADDRATASEQGTMAYVSGGYDVSAFRMDNSEPPADVLIMITPASKDDRMYYGISIESPKTNIRFDEGLTNLRAKQLNQMLTEENGIRKQMESIFMLPDFQSQGEDGTKRNLLDKETLTPAARRIALRKLAEIGYRLYSGLFGKQNKLEPILKEIKEYSLTHRPLRISIRQGASTDKDSNYLRLPFGLLYDDPNFQPDETGEPADVTHFWDYRYVVESVLRIRNGFKPTLCSGGSTSIGAVMALETPDAFSSDGLDEDDLDESSDGDR
jgi:hypothetical protein